VEGVLHDVCPNCGGAFAPRPIRPAEAWRSGTGLANHPPSGDRRRTPYSPMEIDAFVDTLRAVPPGSR
jgi:hypothetical protein